MTSIDLDIPDETPRPEKWLARFFMACWIVGLVYMAWKAWTTWRQYRGN